MIDSIGQDEYLHSEKEQTTSSGLDGAFIAEEKGFDVPFTPDILQAGRHARSHWVDVSEKEPKGHLWIRAICGQSSLKFGLLASERLSHRNTTAIAFILRDLISAPL